MANQITDKVFKNWHLIYDFDQFLTPQIIFSMELEKAMAGYIRIFKPYGQMIDILIWTKALPCGSKL